MIYLNVGFRILKARSSLSGCMLLISSFRNISYISRCNEKDPGSFLSLKLLHTAALI